MGLGSAITKVGKAITTLGGDGGGARGTVAALGTLALSPVYVDAIKQMTTEMAQRWLVGWSPEFQSNAGLLGAGLLTLLLGLVVTKLAHVSRPAEQTDGAGNEA